MAGNFGAAILRTRWLVRLPIWLFRAGLGFLFAGRLVLLEHVGRKSGHARYVVLEVLTRPSRDEFVLASGFGRNAQWFKNLVANQNCHVSIGFRRRVAAVAVVLDPVEATTFLANYQAAHPDLWKQLNSSMVQLHDGNEDYELPLVRVTMTVRS